MGYGMEEFVGSIPTRSTIKSTTYRSSIPSLGNKFPKPISKTGANTVRFPPLSTRRQLNDLPDDLWTRISIEFYKDAADAVFKALVE
jgi:predicted ATP-dependent Lon-type protease